MIFLAAVTGAFCLGGLLLSLMDVVKSRLDEGARVNLVARAYFGMGPWSVLLWVVTLPAMIMFVIIFGILIYDMVITIFPRM